MRVHPCRGIMGERLWLHLFELPFITTGQVENCTQHQELEDGP
jgi:hypothetical protein